MADKKTLKKVHATPGVYFSEMELTYSNKSMGVTRLGVAGETQKGPAFQPIEISDWAQFQTFFGGTSTEKFRGSQYPKYELPYIAKEYLTQSQQLQVCRVLGLSGVNAGPAWCIAAYSTKKDADYTIDKPLVIAVLRSRGTHLKASLVGEDECGEIYAFDNIEYYAKNVSIKPSASLNYEGTCNSGYNSETGKLLITPNNYGTFTLDVETVDGEIKSYSVSLNPGDNQYILSVLGQDPEKGESEIFVEELYDIALEQLILAEKLDRIWYGVTTDDEKGEPEPLIQYPEVYVIPKHAPVNSIVTLDESNLTRRDVGKRFLYGQESLEAGVDVHVSKDKGVEWKVVKASEDLIGHIYTVVRHVNENGKPEFFYGEFNSVDEGERYTPEYLSSEHTLVDKVFDDAVEVKEDGLFYVYCKDEIRGENVNDVKPITIDMNNYKEQYRYASTPWIVSEMKGSATDVELTKLFRFHTISDGNNSNTEVKISIENIDPKSGTFDVMVRDFNDTDKSVTVLEKFKGCDLIPGSPNYIAYRIGSTDENYETKSKFVTVEVNETDKTKVSVPAGFLGYPVRYYDGYGIVGKLTKEGFAEEQVNLTKPYLQYATNVDEDLRISKQYFGLSDRIGIDADMLKYKGYEAYAEIPQSLTPGFHLDSRIFQGVPDPDNDNRVECPKTYAGADVKPQKVSVDGISGYEWVTVAPENVIEYANIQPRFGDEDIMTNTIYEDRRARKFTLCFYGGWDGWDYYRDSRSNTDDYIQRKYRGEVNTTSGKGKSVDVIDNPEAYGFERNYKALTTDYYAYLSAIRMFANPKTIEINHLATPGIDYVNNNLLVGEVIDMVEEERGDSIYVVTTPDKPFGKSDRPLDMYTPIEVIENLEDTEIDSNYVCSSYPWNKYYDSANSQYIYLPPTKDMVRNFAYTDNIKFPWYAAVGWNRGTVNAIAPKKSLKLVEQDELYEGRMNFTNTFAQDGLRLWGDKNFQIHESPMNRISHRRALNRIKTLLNKACIGLIFDPNDASMGKSLDSAIKPVLESVKSNKGLVDYKVVIDDSVEARERLELNAQVYLKLMPNLEYINITLSVLPSGMQISEV